MLLFRVADPVKKLWDADQIVTHAGPGSNLNHNLIISRTNRPSMKLEPDIYEAGCSFFPGPGLTGTAARPDPSSATSILYQDAKH